VVIITTFLIAKFIFIIALAAVKVIFHLMKSKKASYNYERDKFAIKYYESEFLMKELIKISQLEERTKIYANIHDEAGHDIVGALLYFQSLDLEDELYKKAIKKLESGMEKIRSIVHNSSETYQTREKLYEIEPSLKIYGDIQQIPIYVYNMLEILIKECVTNTWKYGKNATFELDITPKIIRFKTENEINKTGKGGIGIINLKNRAMSIGGSVSINITEENFSLICVIPID